MDEACDSKGPHECLLWIGPTLVLPHLFAAFVTDSLPNASHQNEQTSIARKSRTQRRNCTIVHVLLCKFQQRPLLEDMGTVLRKGLALSDAGRRLDRRASAC